MYQSSQTEGFTDLHHHGSHPHTSYGTTNRKKKKLALHLCCHRSSLYGALVITFWPHFAANLQELLLANVSTSPGIAKRNHSFLKRTNQWKILQKPPHPKCRGRASHHSHQDLFLLYLPLLGCNKGSHNTIQDNHHNHQGFFNQE